MIAVDPATEAIVSVAVVAVLAAVTYLLRVLFRYLNRREEAHDLFVEEMRRGHETSMAEQRAAFTQFLGNHMSTNTKAMSDVALNLERLTAEIRELRAERRTV